MTEPLLELRRLTKRFGALLVTDKVDLAVMPGRIHGLIGPNGAGKTTLIHQISGISPPDSGVVLLDGADITALPLHRRARLGLSRGFQITSLIPEFSLMENVALAVQALGPGSLRMVGRVAGNARLNARALELLERVGLADRAREPARRLSHGEKRQLELAVALAGAPRMLLLDEPLAGAGPDETARLVGLLDGIRQTCAILLVEHDMAAVFRLADTISVLAQGGIIATGTPAEIRADGAVRQAYLGEAF